MALINFSDTPNRVNGTGASPAAQVLDVGLYFGSLTLLLQLIELKTSGASPSFVVRLETAMDSKAADWVTVDDFSALTVSNTQTKKTFTALLRYVRWNVVTFDDTISAAFILSGVARNP